MHKTSHKKNTLNSMIVGVKQEQFWRQDWMRHASNVCLKICIFCQFYPFFFLFIDIFIDIQSFYLLMEQEIKSFNG